MTFEEKKSRLLSIAAGICKKDVVLAFSGGADSSLLLSVLKEQCDVSKTVLTAVTADTFLHPGADIDVSARVCRELGVPHKIIRIDELSEAGIEDNPTDRCYLCKRAIFLKIMELADALGAFCVVEGSNLDDTKVYRPGLKAIAELGIISPLKDACLTKEDVRALARERGISTANRPSAPCLATRFPYGTHLDRGMLKKVEDGESYLKSFGLYNVRLRVHGDVARIETDPQSFGMLIEKREEISEHLQDLGYRFITLDLEGFRSGSFDK